MKDTQDTVSVEWKKVPWYGNHFIPFECQEGKVGIRTIVLHQEFICTNSNANDGYGAWKEGTAFEFTVKGCFSGRCPDNIKTWEKAKEYAIRAANRW